MSASKAKTVLEALAEYEYLIAELSEHTQRGYKTRIKRFGVWCQSKKISLKSITPAVVATYLQDLRAKVSEATGDPLAPATLHSHMRAIKTFLFWCAKPPQKYLPLEIPQNLVMPKIDLKIIQPFTKEQIHRLQVAVTQNHFPMIVARDKAVLATPRSAR